MASRAYEAVLYHVLCDRFGCSPQTTTEAPSPAPHALQPVAASASQTCDPGNPVALATVPWRQALAATLEHDQPHVALLTAQGPKADTYSHERERSSHSNCTTFDHVARLLAYQSPLPRTRYFAEDAANAKLLLAPHGETSALPNVPATAQPASNCPEHVLTHMAQQGLAATSIIRLVGQFAGDIPLDSFHRLAKLLDAQGDLGVLVDVLRDSNSSRSPPTLYQELWRRLSIVLKLVPEPETQMALLGALMVKRMARYGFRDHEISPLASEASGGWDYERELTVALNQLTAGGSEDSDSSGIDWHFSIDSPLGSLLALAFVQPWATVCRLVDEAVSRPSITPSVIAIVARLNIAQCRQQRALAYQPYQLPFLLDVILNRADYWVSHGPHPKDYNPIDRLKKLVLAMVDATEIDSSTFGRAQTDSDSMSDEPSDHQGLLHRLPPPLLTATDMAQGLFGELIHIQGLVARPGAFALAVGVVHALGHQVRGQSFTWKPQPCITDSFARQFLQQWSQVDPWKYMNQIINLLQSEYYADTSSDQRRTTLLPLASFQDQLYDILTDLLYTVTCFSGGSGSSSLQPRINAHQLNQLLMALHGAAWPVSLRLAETVQPWLAALGISPQELTWHLPRSLLGITGDEQPIQWASNIVLVDEPLVLSSSFAKLGHSEDPVLSTTFTLLQVAASSPSAGWLAVKHLQGYLQHYSAQVLSILPRCLFSVTQLTTRVEYGALCTFVQEYLTWYAVTISDFDTQLAAAMPGWELLFTIDLFPPSSRSWSRGWLAYRCLFMGAIFWGLGKALSAHDPTRVITLLRPLCQALQLGRSSPLCSQTHNWVAWPLDHGPTVDNTGNQGVDGHAKLVGLLLDLDAYHRTVELLLTPGDHGDPSPPVDDALEPDSIWFPVQRFVCDQLQVLILDQVDQLCAALTAGGTAFTLDRIMSTPAYQQLQTRMDLLPNKQLAHTIRAKLNSVGAGNRS
ncbi:hypothetical protein H4R34_004039 [Dimargaris verticillata]|uniref:Uncharacterized protein n=1 Tax=Dimargaris verticillata TaxID=2761393 RepID=A0A9W8EC22_9FUNG|nr:hypothetical protein H4R34_004039 [Dimargaris verticillata]